jgi:hypothetical protein
MWSSPPSSSRRKRLEEEKRALAGWVKSVDRNIPLHVTPSSPPSMTDVPPTTPRSCFPCAPSRGNLSPTSSRQSVNKRLQKWGAPHRLMRRAPVFFCFSQSSIPTMTEVAFTMA